MDCQTAIVLIKVRRGLARARHIFSNQTERQHVKRFGIRFTLPPGDTRAAPHLLGGNWQAFRWYDSEAERDRAYEELTRPLEYYRRGDNLSQIVTKVEE